MNNPYILIGVFFLMMVVFVVIDFTTFYRKRFTHWDFKSTIVSLGILGTFIGISIGLWGFDTTAIEASVPKLLAGLKLAFMTSVLGMSFSIVLAIIQRFSSSGAAANKPEKEQFAEMTEQIKQQRAELRDGFQKSHVTLGKIADSTGRFDGQISGLRTELQDQSGQSRELIKGEFAKANQTLAESLKKISEGANKEIIDALNESIRGFNQNLIEQFGENFTRLNDACLKLVEWQEHHKQEVEATHKQLGDSVAALTQTEQTLAAVSGRNQEVLKTYDSLRETIATYGNQTDTLTTHLEKYGALADKAEQMFAGADSRFTKITDALGGFAEELKDKISTQSEAVAGLARQMGEHNEGIAGDLRQSITDMQTTINAQSQTLKELADSIVESVGEMEQIFVNVTEKMGEKYKDFLSGAEHIARMAPRTGGRRQ